MKACDLYNNHGDEIFQKFYDMHLLHNLIDSVENKKIIPLYKKAILLLICSVNDENNKDIKLLFKRIFILNIKNKIPYVVAVNKINYLKNLIVEVLVQKNSNDSALNILKIFITISNLGSKLYLNEYVDKLIGINNIRITSMSDILKKNVVIHYTEHLNWVTELALAVRHGKIEDIPETDPSECDFGKWLATEAKYLIQNNSRYKAILNLHEELHYFADKIKSQFKTKDYHAFLSYLEKCELISLNIGTELALIDNILLNKMVTKDPLTKSLNRNVLKQIFESQYEIAFATSNSIVMAMCDLDYFKKVNDTYGHLAGDKMLVEFTKIVHKRIRNSDILIRYGGEEFIIILPAATKEQGIVVLSAIKESFASFVLEFEGRQVSTTVSMGMIEITPDEFYNKHKLEEYIAIVDKKLYIAKNAGRNQIYF